jgi:alpha-galactosidase
MCARSKNSVIMEEGKIVMSNPAKVKRTITKLWSAQSQPAKNAMWILLLLSFSSLRGVAQLALTPPMGWNSWNHFGIHFTDQDIRVTADILARNGMREAGYIYVNIDDGWQGERDETGALHGNKNFPDMKALVDYVHARGLKVGIYSTPGEKSCDGFTGGKGHEQQDAATFAQWGIDFLKYDVCTFRDDLAREAKGDPELARSMMETAFRTMHEAILKTGRPIVYSVSQHGLSSGWTWVAGTGAQLWRIGDDVHDNYESITGIGFAQAGLGRFAGPGHWNDPDMLEIGNGKLAEDEDRTQVSLWSILAAPLIAGNDVSRMSPEALRTLTNAEVIAVDQDPAGRQGDRVWSQGPLEIWSRDLKDGSKVVGLFNRNAGASEITLDLSLFGADRADTVRDLWKHEQLPAIQKRRTFLVPRHGVVLLRMTTKA